MEFCSIALAVSRLGNIQLHARAPRANGSSHFADGDLQGAVDSGRALDLLCDRVNERLTFRLALRLGIRA